MLIDGQQAMAAIAEAIASAQQFVHITGWHVALIAADDGAGRLLAATLRSLSGTREDPLYVHAKVAIVDDRWLTVGSANLNAHALFNDTEMNVCTDDRGPARRTRLRLWAEHLDRTPSPSIGCRLDLAGRARRSGQPEAALR